MLDVHVYLFVFIVRLNLKILYVWVHFIHSSDLEIQLAELVSLNV